MRAPSPFTPSIVRLTRPVDPDCFGTFRKPSVSPECQLPRLVFEVVRFFPDTLRGVAASQLRKKQTRCHSSALRNGSGVSGLSPALRLRSERSLSPPGCAWLFSGSSYFRMFPYPLESLPTSPAAPRTLSRLGRSRPFPATLGCLVANGSRPFPREYVRLFPEAYSRASVFGLHLGMGWEERTALPARMRSAISARGAGPATWNRGDGG